MGMERCNDGGAFADGAPDPFDGAGTDVADGENASDARFIALQGAFVLRGGSGQYEALIVQLHIAIGEPFGRRFGADEHENIANRPDFL